MELIADSAPFSSDNRFNGFLFLMLAATPLIVISTYLLVLPPSGIPLAATAAFAIGSVIVILLFGLYLKTRGYLFKIPFRVLDTGIMVQPTTSIRPKIVEWPDITSLELWVGVVYKKSNGGSTMLTPEGEIKSIELFRDKEALKEFVSSIKPLLEENGMKMTEEDEDDSGYSVKFRRGLSLIPSRL